MTSRCAQYPLVSPSVSLSVRYQLVKMLTTLEPHGILYLYTEHQSGWSWSVSAYSHTLESFTRADVHDLYVQLSTQFAFYAFLD